MTKDRWLSAACLAVLVALTLSTCAPEANTSSVETALVYEDKGSIVERFRDVEADCACWLYRENGGAVGIFCLPCSYLSKEACE